MENTLFDIIIKIATAVGTLLAGFAIIVAVKQLKELRKQLDDSRKWNRMSSAFHFCLNDSKFNEMEQIENTNITY